MPKRRTAWASWNYVESSSGDAFFTYWMNRLQGISEEYPLFVTLNPPREPAEGTIHRVEFYDHPAFTTATIDAQRRLWGLQGRERTWFCGAYFGSGFHEDGLQAGLAVAEELGELRRPWQIAIDSSRICRDAIADPLPLGVSL